MKLCAEEKWVFCLREFRNLHEPPVRRRSGKNESRFFYSFNIFGIHLVAMAVTFDCGILSIRAICNGSLLQYGGIGAEAHGAAILFFLHEFFLFRQYIYDRMRGLRVYLRCMGVLQARHIPRVFDNHELHAITKAEVRNFMFPRIPYGLDLSLHTSGTESTRHDDAVILLIFFQRKFFRVHPVDYGLHVLRVGRVLYRLYDGNVGIFKNKIAGAEIFSHYSYVYLPSDGFYLFYERFPLAPFALSCLYAEFFQNPFSHVFFFKIHGDFIDTFHIRRGDHVPFLHTTHKLDFLFSFRVKRRGRAPKNHIRMNSHGVQTADRVLGWLGF